MTILADSFFFPVNDEENSRTSDIFDDILGLSYLLLSTSFIAQLIIRRTELISQLKAEGSLKQGDVVRNIEPIKTQKHIKNAFASHAVVTSMLSTCIAISLLFAA